jgi:hypothetical protein
MDAYFGRGGGSQFEGYPLPCSRLGSFWLSVRSVYLYRFICLALVIATPDDALFLCFVRHRRSPRPSRSRPRWHLL